MQITIKELEELMCKIEETYEEGYKEGEVYGYQSASEVYQPNMTKYRELEKRFEALEKENEELKKQIEKNKKIKAGDPF